MIRRKKTTIFTDAKETTNVSELKKIIQGITTFLLDHLKLINKSDIMHSFVLTGITKVAPENQRLYKDERIMEDNRCLADYGLISSTARAQSPASLRLSYR